MFFQTKLFGGLALITISAGAITQVAHESESGSTSEVTVPAVSKQHAANSLTASGRPDLYTSNTAESAAHAPDFSSLQKLLNETEAAAAQYAHYTATLELQEDLQGTLQPRENIEVKVRRTPFSVYMRWERKDQEAIFVEGRNDNRMLVKPTKALAALRRIWRLDPESRMAKQSCRYPVTDSGLEKLVTRTRLFYATRNDWADHVKCYYSADNVGNVDVTVFNVHFSRTASPDFSRSRYFLDERRGLMIGLENYGWTSDGGEGQLAERYVYHSINSKVDLKDEDFDHENPEYSFVAR